MITKTQLSLTTTVSAMTGGADVVQGIGQDYLFTFGSTYNGLDFTIGDLLTMTLTDQSTSYQTQVGAGNVTGTSPVFAFTYEQKVYTLANYSVYFSAIDQPTVWNDLNAIGNNFVPLSDFYGTQQALVAASPFQGRIAFFSRFAVQIYNVNADPNQWARVQVLQNTGTVAPLSVQSLGDFDVMYLSDTGIRSLRAKETTLNAFVDDVGSPVDTLVTASNGSNTGACAVVEPKTGRYWCLVNGVIYVLSRYLSTQITAWAQYLPTTQTTLTPTANIYIATVGYKYYWVKGSNDTSLSDGTTTLTASGYITAAATSLTRVGTSTTNGFLYENTPFTPVQFLLYNGQIWCRDATRFYQYGGVSGTQTDYTQGIAATTWLDLNYPANLKKAVGLDAAFNGYFGLYVGMDQLNSSPLKQVYNGTQVTFQKGGIPVSTDGYHVKLQAVTLDNNPATLSSLCFAYKTRVEKEDGH